MRQCRTTKLVFFYDRIIINAFWRIVYLLPGNRLIKAFGSGDRLAMTRNRARFWMVIDCFVSNNDTRISQLLMQAFALFRLRE